MANPASAIASKKESAKNATNDAKNKMNEMKSKAEDLKTKTNVTQQLNLGSLAGKLAQAGVASAILAKAMPGNILPKLVGAMGAVEIIKNISAVMKEAKKASKSKSGIGDNNSETEQKEKAAEEKANKQAEIEKERDKKAQQEEEQKKQAGSVAAKATPK